MNSKISSKKTMMLAWAGSNLGAALVTQFGHSAIGLSHSGKSMQSSLYTALKRDLINPPEVVAPAGAFHLHGVYVCRVVRDRLMASNNRRLTHADVNIGCLSHSSQIADKYWRLAHQSHSPWARELSLCPSAERS